MKLSKILIPELIVLEAGSSSKDELLAVLIDRIYALGLQLPLSQNDMIKAIQLREDVGGTVLPSGLSIPHARVDTYEGFIIAIAIPKEPLFFDGIQIRMMAMMISNQTGGAHYLKTLSGLARMSRDKKYFLRLCNAENPDDFLNIIRERDFDLP